MTKEDNPTLVDNLEEEEEEYTVEKVVDKRMTKAGKTEYYLVKNAVSEKFGMSCMKARPAVAT